MKIRIIKRIILLLTIAVSVMSCSKALLFIDDSDGLAGKEGKLIISGIITDRETNSPLEGIRVSFQCDADNFEKISAYTDNDGIYMIKADGFTKTITGCVTARDISGYYQPITRNIKVNWKGESYDPQKAIFAINDCNFQLTR